MHIEKQQLRLFVNFETPFRVTLNYPTLTEQALNILVLPETLKVLHKILNKTILKFVQFKLKPTLPALLGDQ